MTEQGIIVEGLWKKFHRGELHDSLRDLIPAVTKRLFRRGPRNTELGAGDFWALEDLSFSVTPGEALGVIGPNGAGKSTLLKILSRILRSDRGTVRVRGRVGALIEVAAGFHPDLTGRENIYLQGAILGMKHGEIARKFDEIVAFSGIEAFIDTPVKRYSSGMNARLGFSIATSLEQEVLLIDEVLSVGDWAFQRQCNHRMQELVRSGATVIFVSHNHQAIGSLCRESLLLVAGKKVAAGSSEAVIRDYLSGLPTSTARSDAPARVKSVTLRGRGGECWQFEPGEEAWVDIEVEARKRCEKLAVGIYVQDEAGHEIFNTSTERLGAPTIDLEAGKCSSCTFQLAMHLARGTFHLGVRAQRYDVMEYYDTRFPAATIHIHSDIDVRGSVNLYPRVITDHRIG